MATIRSTSTSTSNMTNLSKLKMFIGGKTRSGKVDIYDDTVVAGSKTLKLRFKESCQSVPVSSGLIAAIRVAAIRENLKSYNKLHEKAPQIIRGAVLKPGLTDELTKEYKELIDALKREFGEAVDIEAKLQAIVTLEDYRDLKNIAEQDRNSVWAGLYAAMNEMGMETIETGSHITEASPQYEQAEVGTPQLRQPATPEEGATTKEIKTEASMEGGLLERYEALIALYSREGVLEADEKTKVSNALKEALYGDSHCIVGGGAEYSFKAANALDQADDGGELNIDDLINAICLSERPGFAGCEGSNRSRTVRRDGEWVSEQVSRDNFTNWKRFCKRELEPFTGGGIITQEDRAKVAELRKIWNGEDPETKYDGTLFEVKEMSEADRTTLSKMKDIVATAALEEANVAESGEAVEADKALQQADVVINADNIEAAKKLIENRIRVRPAEVQLIVSLEAAAQAHRQAAATCGRDTQRRDDRRDAVTDAINRYLAAPSADLTERRNLLDLVATMDAMGGRGFIDQYCVGGKRQQQLSVLRTRIAEGATTPPEAEGVHHEADLSESVTARSPHAGSSAGYGVTPDGGTSTQPHASPFWRTGGQDSGAVLTCEEADAYAKSGIFPRFS